MNYKVKQHRRYDIVSQFVENEIITVNIKITKNEIGKKKNILIITKILSLYYKKCRIHFI